MGGGGRGGAGQSTVKICAVPQARAAKLTQHTLLENVRVRYFANGSSSPPLRILPLMRFRISSCQTDTCTGSAWSRLTGAEGTACLPSLAGKVRIPGTSAPAFRGVVHALLEGPPGGHAVRVSEAFEESGLLFAAARGHSSSRARQPDHVIAAPRRVASQRSVGWRGPCPLLPPRRRGRAVVGQCPETIDRGLHANTIGCTPRFAPKPTRPQWARLPLSTYAPVEVEQKGARSTSQARVGALEHDFGI